VLVCDACTDGTVVAALEAGSSRKRAATVTEIVDSPKNKGAMRHLYEYVHTLPPETVVIYLDGDDWLWRADAVSIVAKAYANPDVWMTFGQFVHATGEPGWAAPYWNIGKEINFREQGFLATHLKTFRAGLFQSIRLDQFLVEHAQGLVPRDNEWITEALDVAIMFPMLEMAGERHRFIPEVLMCYENENPTSPTMLPERRAQQVAECKRLMALPRYSRLEVAPW
jgi:hypothetical protein